MMIQFTDAPGPTEFSWTSDGILSLVYQQECNTWKYIIIYFVHNIIHLEVFLQQIYTYWEGTNYFDGFLQDWGNSISNTLELPQSFTNPSIYTQKK